VLYWHMETKDPLSNPELAKIRAERSYKNHDIITGRATALPNYEQKIKDFFEEHLHEDEEIRFVLEGSGYFDVRDTFDPRERWIRIEVNAGDMIVLPAGIWHRFTLDSNNYIRAMRLFQDLPKWQCHNRVSGPHLETLAARSCYKAGLADVMSTGAARYDPAAFARQQSAKAGPPPVAVAPSLATTDGVNGRSYVVADGARALAAYPHVRRAGGLLFVAGLSSRRNDNTHRGAVLAADGRWQLDIAEQTAGCLDNLRTLLRAADADLDHLVDLTCFLTDMKHYDGFNKVYNTYFHAASGPTRTTVAVHQLPHPNLLVEIKAIAVAPAVAACSSVRMS